MDVIGETNFAADYVRLMRYCVRDAGFDCLGEFNRTTDFFAGRTPEL